MFCTLLKLIFVQVGVHFPPWLCDWLHPQGVQPEVDAGGWQVGAGNTHLPGLGGEFFVIN